MRIGPKWAVRVLEHYLYHYFEEKENLKGLKRDIIQSTATGLQGYSGGTENRRSDPTAAKGTKLATNPDIIQKETWLSVIYDLLGSMKFTDIVDGTCFLKFINKKYFDELGENQICKELGISRSTFYDMRGDILAKGVELAAAKGLIPYKDLIEN